MSNTTLKISHIEKHPSNQSFVITRDRCVSCGLRIDLKEYKGFLYCAVCLADEEKLDAIVDYNTNFSSPDPFENELIGEI